ncbi:MAG: hypothetical protein AAGA26_01940 [Pseudomonadota bacterium]
MNRRSLLLGIMASIFFGDIRSAESQKIYQIPDSNLEPLRRQELDDLSKKIAEDAISLSKKHYGEEPEIDTRKMNASDKLYWNSFYSLKKRYYFEERVVP